MQQHLHEFVARIKSAPKQVASELPVPDWSHLGSKSNRNEVIAFDDIYIDPTEGNPTRLKMHSGTEIERLKIAFSAGVELSEYPMAVARTTLREKPFELIYGNGRTTALLGLNVKKWVFTVIEANDKNLSRIALSENKKRLPKVDINRHEMINGLNQMIHDGNLENEVKAIGAEAKLLWNLGKEELGRVVEGVVAQSETPQPFWYWSNKVAVNLWVTNHALDKTYAIDGNLDEGRNMYGSMCKNGYLPAKAIQAFSRLSKTGKKTYILGHVDAPSMTNTICDKRTAFMKAYYDMKSMFASLGIELPLEVLGFLPQVKGIEEIETIIPAHLYA
jgi:hypothetical protein|tara:strand:+ start:170 stop:1165 length:996 start_codon:yes stop_codon:yes gene_type:complete